MPGGAGSLFVVGTGIRPISQTPPDALGAIEFADAVFYLATEPLTATWLQRVNPHARSLQNLYAVGKDRRETYAEMIDCVLAPLREGKDVCFVSYGHPGVFAYPMHEVVRIARAEGYKAVMVPGISAEDCLFADLGVDPGDFGCQNYEATDFLIHRRVFDPTSSLILWQIGVIGVNSYQERNDIWNPGGLEVLVDILVSHYSQKHEAVVYEASPFAWCNPRIERTTLSRVSSAKITPISTLYVPPKEQRPLDDELINRLRATSLS